jgi:hypothetical protein
MKEGDVYDTKKKFRKRDLFSSLGGLLGVRIFSTPISPHPNNQTYPYCGAR